MVSEEVFRNMTERGLTLPDPPRPGGYYDSVRILGGVAYIAVQFPFLEGEIPLKGRIGQDLSTLQGFQAAELCALNILAQIHKYVGFGSIVGLNRIDAMMQTAPEWDEFPQVLDGASRLFLDVLGDAGRHARTLVGVERLPLDAPITLTATFTVTNF